MPNFVKIRHLSNGLNRKLFYAASDESISFIVSKLGMSPALSNTSAYAISPSLSIINAALLLTPFISKIQSV